MSGTKQSGLEDWVEAVLFVSGRKMKISEIARIVGTSREKVLEALKKLEKKFSGPIIVEFNKEFAVMRLQEKYLKKLWKLANPELSEGELRTLAVIAYYGKIKQSDLVRIRGNKAYEHVKKLEKLGLVKAKKVGNTKLLEVGEKFNEYFGGEIVNRIRHLQASARA